MSVSMKRGDRHPAFTSLLQSPPGTAIPLSGATVKFLMSDRTGALKVNAAATVVDPVAGSVSYSWGPSDTDTIGTFRIEWEITYGDGTKLSVPNDGFITLNIMADLG